MQDTADRDFKANGHPRPLETAPASSDAQLIRDLIRTDQKKDDEPQVKSPTRSPREKEQPRIKVWRQVDFDRLRRYATPKNIGLGVLLIAVAVAPLRTALTLLALVCGLIVLFFALGPQRSAEIARQVHARIGRVSPEKAERLRALSEAIVSRVGRIAERLPERWTEDLYLPDLSADRSRKDDVALERLRRMAEEN